MAFAEARVSSEPDTLDRSVSKTPDLKLSTSKLVRVLLSRSILLLVKVCEPTNVATVASIAKVKPLPEAVEVRPVPPNKDNVSESRSMLMLVVPSVASKSCAVTCAST